jgi:hypothetical protein
MNSATRKVLPYFLLLAVSSFLGLFAGVECGEVDKGLLEEFKTKKLLNDVYVELTDSTNKVMDELNKQKFDDPGAKNKALTTALQAHATKTQKLVTEFLDKEGLKYNSLWISNAVVVTEINEDQATRLAQVDGVKLVRASATASAGAVKG